MLILEIKINKNIEFIIKLLFKLLLIIYNKK